MEIAKFPLLNLPYIAIEEVMSTWNPYDLINFSLVSPITKTITKSFFRIKSKRYEVVLGIFSKPKITVIVYPHHRFVFEMTCDKSKSDSLSINEHRQKIKKYAEDIIKGYKIWSDHIMDVMNCHSIESISFYTDDYPNENKSFIDWLRSKSVSIDTIEICTSDDQEENDDEIVSYVLKHLKITKELIVYVDLSEKFEANTIRNISNQVIFSSGRWITLQNILEYQAKRIKIEDLNNWGNEDLNKFILSWMASESNSNLILFDAMVSARNNITEILKGVPHEVIDSEVVRHFEEDFRDVMVYGGYNITRSIDGKKATLYTRSYGDKLLFRMHVL